MYMISIMQVCHNAFDTITSLCKALLNIIIIEAALYKIIIIVSLYMIVTYVIIRLSCNI
jgi:hypothetical protein